MLCFTIFVLRKDKDNMKRNTVNLTRIFNVVCAVLMLALLICQLVPFWSLEGREVSIGGYVWFVSDHGDLTAYFQEWLGNGDFDAGSIAGIDTIIIVACVIGLIFCLKNNEDIWPVIFPAVCGILGLYQYITFPVFQLGNNWGFHLAICIAMLVMAIVTFIAWMQPYRKCPNGKKDISNT